MSQTKILVIDDSPITQESLTNILSAQEAEVVVAGSGEEGLDLLKQGFRPNLIVLDLNLPGINGPEVLENIRNDARWQHIPVVPFSALWNENTGGPTDRSKKIVQDWMTSRKRSEIISEGKLANVTPKYKGKEDVEVINPSLIVAIAHVLIDQKVEIEPGFERLVQMCLEQLEDNK